MDKFFRIGHYTDIKNVTGCTVILCPPKVIASCYICGSSPGTREIALLAPERKIESIHALFLTGGSAFGLNAAGGVVQYLEEKNIGYDTSFIKVPLVPAAVIYDMNIGSNTIRPSAENAYQACKNADEDFSEEGSIGAGTGATIGKWNGLTRSMKGGLGISEIKSGNAWVRAISIVNSVGDIVDEYARIIAGAHDEKGKFFAQEDRTVRWGKPQVGFAENTVLSALLTNVIISKLDAYNLARRAQNGLARAINPACTSYDGDIIFALSQREVELHFEVLCEMAAEAIRKSIISGARKARSLGGIPSILAVSEFQNKRN
jgi:L-aminopeptidase/D-esterase-like protein